MSRILVVSQPMFLPWIGMFEQIRLADVFVHQDDVQLPQGKSFIRRVQVKSSQGISWLSAPIDRANSGKLINEVALLDGTHWRGKHLKTLQHAYARTPYFRLMFDLAQQIYDGSPGTLSEFNINALERVAKWLGLAPRFLRSSELAVPGAGTERLIDLCARTECDVYVTGHGGLQFLNHRKFDECGIAVRYMDYKKVPYRQSWGEFTPYVSVLDAIAHCGERTRELLCSDAVYWKDFKLPSAAQGFS